VVEHAGIGGEVRWLAFILGAIGLSALAQGPAPRLRGVPRPGATKFGVVVLPPLGVPAVASGATALGTLAVGSLAVAGLAIGALAIGALAVGRLEIRNARLRKVEIDDLTVRRLRVVEQSGEEAP
jgi:hypothetical protein